MPGPKRIFPGLVFAFLFVLMAGSHFQTASAQDGSYTLTPAPDVWYNEVDGIRVGIRVLGEMEGTFLDGPHRLDAGVWLSTWFPDLPVSYYLSFTEPIPAISSFGSEGNVQFESSIRTGFSKHGLYFNKRWQFGFDERKYIEFTTGLSSERMFDEEYRQYPSHWIYHTQTTSITERETHNEQIHLLNAGVLLHQRNILGRYTIDLNFKQQLNEDILPPFTRFDAELTHKIPLGSGFGFNLRSFLGIANKEVPYQYSYLASMKSMVGWMDRGLSRAKGTIPMSIFDNGIFQFSGGPNLRGYLKQDITLLNQEAFGRAIDNSDHYLMTSALSFNAELDVPNPLHKKLKSIPLLGDFLAMRSYMFYDVGFIPDGRGGSLFETNKSDFGTGFQLSVNVPDYLGKDRGLFIRYDIPFWLSHPAENDDNFEFRHLIGIGAVISL